jgi:hypothetical protein
VELTPRVSERLDRDFGDRRDQAVYVIQAVDIGAVETEGSERIQTAMLICAAGDLDRLVDAAALAETDWRDLLVNAELADDDWRDGVDAYLAPLTTGE